MREGFGRTAVGVGVHRQERSRLSCSVRSEPCAPSAFTLVVKHARGLGQPAPDIGRMPQPHAEQGESPCCIAPKCAAAAGADISLPAGGVAAKLPVCSTSWHCCRGGSAYILLNESKFPAGLAARG